MKRKYLTQEEIEKLLSATDRMPFPERNRCLILMAFIHGFRASELLGLRLSDIDLWGGNYFCTDRRCYKLIVKSTTTRPMGDLGILHCAEKNDLKMIFLP
ncbi:tyrosine-type recombinase/integrase [Salmonella enterica]